MRKIQWLWLLTLYLLLISDVIAEFPAPAINFVSCNYSDDNVDRALISFNFSSAATAEQVLLYGRNTQCHNCRLRLLANASATHCLSLYTPFPYELFLFQSPYNEQPAFFHNHVSFGENGKYQLDISATDVQSSELARPIDSYAPLVVLIIVLVVIGTLWFAYEPLFALWSSSTLYTPLANTAEPLLASPPPPPANPNRKQRLASLDTFRGIALCLMIFVNYGGGGYYFFDHAPWHGLTVADLVFPWFMFMMGVSMAFSFNKLNTEDLNYGTQYVETWRRVLLRTVKLFLLGMFIANGYEYSTWRVPGVLQYFSVAYFSCAAVLLLCHRSTQQRLSAEAERDKLQRGDKDDGAFPLAPTTAHDAEDGEAAREAEAEKRGRCAQLGMHGMAEEFSAFLRVLWCYRAEFPAQLSFLLLYLCVHFLAAAPGCPVGYQGAGGDADNGAYPDCTGGIHRFIDMSVFGWQLIYHHPTCLSLYDCIPYDPEGLLGVLSAISLTYFGLLVGRVFLHVARAYTRIMVILSMALPCLLLAGLFCNFSQNDGVMPVNKNLWTTSFILVTGGMACIGLSLCYYVVDIRQFWTGAPYLYLGMNSILFYVAHQLLQPYFPFSYMIYHVNHASLLTCHLFGVLAWLLIAYYFYKIKFFVTV